MIHLPNVFCVVAASPTQITFEKKKGQTLLQDTRSYLLLPLMLRLSVSCMRTTRVYLLLELVVQNPSGVRNVTHTCCIFETIYFCRGFG